MYLGGLLGTRNGNLGRHRKGHYVSTHVIIRLKLYVLNYFLCNYNVKDSKCHKQQGHDDENRCSEEKTTRDFFGGPIKKTE